LDKPKRFEKLLTRKSGSALRISDKTTWKSSFDKNKTATMKTGIYSILALAFLLSVNATNVEQASEIVRELGSSPTDAPPKPKPKPKPSSSNSSSSTSSFSTGSTTSTSNTSKTTSNSSGASPASVAVGFVALAGLAGAAAFRSRREITVGTHALKGSIAKRMQRMDKFVRPDLETNFVGMEDDAAAQV
jgi:MYXO-CTERM domain-containing protein